MWVLLLARSEPFTVSPGRTSAMFECQLRISYASGWRGSVCVCAAGHLADLQPPSSADLVFKMRHAQMLSIMVYLGKLSAYRLLSPPISYPSKCLFVCVRACVRACMYGCVCVRACVLVDIQGLERVRVNQLMLVCKICIYVSPMGSVPALTVSIVP